MQRTSVFSRPVSTRPAVGTSLLLALAMTASACGTGSSTEAASGEDVATEFESPIGEFLGFSNDFNNEDEQARQKEIERKAQELAAACMRAEGFEYTPVDYSEFDNFTGEEEGLEWGSKEWTEKYGFGISTQRYSQAEVGPDLVGHNYPDFMEEEGEGFVDPNEEYANSLPEAEQQVYYETLHGQDDGPEWDDSLTEEENNEIMDDYYNESYVPSGCMNEAYQEASGGESIQNFFQQFGGILEEMEDRFESDSRVVEYRTKVSTCVAEKGFEYTNEESVYEDIEARMGDLGNNQFGDPFDGVDPDTLSDEEMDAIFAQMNNISEEDKVKLGVVQEYELGLAAAVLGCSNGSIYSYQNPELNKIRAELEQEFLDANADALEEFKGMAGG